MIIWSGWGFLVPVITWAGAGIIVLIMLLFGQSIEGKDIIIVPLTFLIGGISTYLFHKYVLAKTEIPRELIDTKTNQKVIFRRRNHLFFIPFRYWPYILELLGLLSFIDLITRR
jgi:hypothetical protein